MNVCIVYSLHGKIAEHLICSIFDNFQCLRQKFPMLVTSPPPVEFHWKALAERI